jgi:hypothetical protein
VSTTGIELQLLSSYSVLVRVGNFELQLDNSDRFVNLVGLRVLNRSALSSHGLLGQTWRLPTQPGKRVRYIEGDVEEYAEQSNNCSATS